MGGEWTACKHGGARFLKEDTIPASLTVGTVCFSRGVLPLTHRWSLLILFFQKLFRFLQRGHTKDKGYKGEIKTSLTIRELQIRTPVRSLLAPQERLLLKRQKVRVLEKHVQKREHLHCWWECKLSQSMWKMEWRLLKKLRMEPPYTTPGYIREGNGPSGGGASEFLCLLQHYSQWPEDRNYPSVHRQRSR